MSQPGNYYWGWLLLIASKIIFPHIWAHFSPLRNVRASGGRARCADSRGDGATHDHNRPDRALTVSVEALCGPTNKQTTHVCAYCSAKSLFVATYHSHTAPPHTHAHTLQSLGAACLLCERPMQSNANLCTLDNEPLTSNLNI